MITNKMIRAGLLIMLLFNTTGCIYTRVLWSEANQDRTRFHHLEPKTVSTLGGRSIVASYYVGAEKSSFNIPLNPQGRPVPPYDFPSEGIAGFDLADSWGKGVDARSAPGAAHDQVSQAGSPTTNQWYHELGNNKVAAAYRLKDSGQIEPVTGATQNLSLVVGPRSNCIFVVMPLERSRPLSAQVAAKVTAVIATPFTLVEDTVCFPMELFLIGIAHGLS